jgi:hypothetical protein
VIIVVVVISGSVTASHRLPQDQWPHADRFSQLMKRSWTNSDGGLDAFAHGLHRWRRSRLVDVVNFGGELRRIEYFDWLKGSTDGLGLVLGLRIRVPRHLLFPIRYSSTNQNIKVDRFSSITRDLVCLR